MTDLDKMIELVAAGEKWTSQLHWLDRKMNYAAKCAFHGSLDAALRLHEAMLPGWVARPQAGGNGAGVTTWHCTVEDWESGEEIDANNMPTPARAWLLAILRALESMEDPGDGWTWNERLGWIGPDGKPADPRRRG